jgi:hypothetical protein
MREEGKSGSWDSKVSLKISLSSIYQYEEESSPSLVVFSITMFIIYRFIITKQHAFCLINVSIFICLFLYRTNLGWENNNWFKYERLSTLKFKEHYLQKVYI